METLQDIPVFKSELFDLSSNRRQKNGKSLLSEAPEFLLEEQKFKKNQSNLTLTIISLWILVQLITFLKNLFIYNVMGEAMNYSNQITKRSIPLMSGILFIILISKSTKHLFQSKTKLARVPAFHFLIAVFVTTTVFILSVFAVNKTGMSTFANSNVVKFFMMEVDRLFLIFLLASITITAHYYFHKVRLRELELIKMEKTYQEAEIISLNNEVNPHMISNTLNNIYTLITTDIDEAKNMIIDFAQLLRQNLKSKDAIYTSLEHEKKFIKKYVSLLQKDHQKKYSIRFDYAKELNAAIIPKMVLQPLVENAIKHCGLREKEVLKIEIAAEQVEQELKISVKNQFRKTKDPFVNNSAIGIGTENILKRLKVLYRNNFRFDLYENEKFFTCILNIPLSLDISLSPT